MPPRTAPARGLSRSCRARLRPPTPLAVRLSSASAPAPKTPRRQIPPAVTVRGQTYSTDPAWFNVPASVLEATARQLHLQPDHPVCVTRQIIESHFPAPTFRHYNHLGPVVSTLQNFDALGFLADHPGRALTDTYYINATTLLRTHTSAHQADAFRASASAGFLISADVYRRDEIDRSHYPVFHQMEGARSWDRGAVPGGDVAAAVRRDADALPRHGVAVEDPGTPFDAERNPRQEGHHSAAEAEAIGGHLKRSLENMVADVFSRAQAAAGQAAAGAEPLRMRWVEAFFPFTSPSWELEVLYAGDWLEVLGCGVVQQRIYADAGVPTQLGWAFGIGLERVAMLLFGIPDIRLFWSRDARFLQQFAGLSAAPAALRRFRPFSRHPPCPRDVSFWLPPGGAAHANDVAEVVRGAAGDAVEDVKLTDEFTHPATGRRSRTYRVVYRRLDRTMTSPEAVDLHGRVAEALERKLGVEVRWGVRGAVAGVP